MKEGRRERISNLSISERENDQGVEKEEEKKILCNFSRKKGLAY